MTSTDSPALLAALARTLDSPPDICIQVDGKKIHTFSEVISQQGSLWVGCVHWDGVKGGKRADETATHFLEIAEHSYDVVRASIFWLTTKTIHFTDPDSQALSTVTSPLPTPVAPFEVYRFAHTYGITDLSAISLAALKATFNPATIMGQIFEDRIKNYPEVKDAMVDYVKRVCGEVKEREEYSLVLEGMRNRVLTLHESSVVIDLLLRTEVLSASSATSSTKDLLSPVSIQSETALEKEGDKDQDEVITDVGGWRDRMEGARVFEDQPAKRALKKQQIVQMTQQRRMKQHREEEQEEAKEEPEAVAVEPCLEPEAVTEPVAVEVKAKGGKAKGGKLGKKSSNK